MAFYPIKKNKIWIIKALDRSRGRTIAWVIGDRDVSTFRRLYKKFEQLKDAVFYTDDWEAFKKVLPPERHIIPIPIKYSFYKFLTGELLPNNLFSGNKIISKLF